MIHLLFNPPIILLRAGSPCQASVVKAFGIEWLDHQLSHRGSKPNNLTVVQPEIAAPEIDLKELQLELDRGEFLCPLTINKPTVDLDRKLR